MNDKELEQDFKELNVYLDDIYAQGAAGVKDAGHLWIAFTDKFSAFEKRVKSAHDRITWLETANAFHQQAAHEAVAEQNRLIKENEGLKEQIKVFKERI